MILPDHEIRKLSVCPDGLPLIEPFNDDQLQPASYDVRLGNDFKVFERNHLSHIDLDDPDDITKHVHIDDGGYLTLHPGEFILGVTKERVNMPNGLVSRIEGKSSLGRLGLLVHVTAGFIDPGFSGPITLEMACVHPLAIRLRPHKLIAQLSFHEMSSPAEKPYAGRYQNATTVESSRYGAQMRIDPEPCDYCKVKGREWTPECEDNKRLHGHRHR